MAEETRITPASPLRTTLVFAVALIPAAITGYYLVFSEFAPYDDEGYLMMTVKKFLEGVPLYDEVYTQYGPAYYLIKWFVHSITRLPVTHDVTRLMTLGIWLLISVAAGVFTRNVTRSPAFGVIGLSVSFLTLFKTVFEPGHPQESCGLLIVLGLTASALLPSSRWKLISIAVTLALLTLIKLNLGIFFGLATAIAIVQATQKNRLTSIGFYMLAALGILLPFILFFKYLSFGWLGFSIMVAASFLAIVIVTRKSNSPTQFEWPAYLLFSVTFLAVGVVTIAFVIARGTSLPQLAEGMFFQNLRFSELFFQAAPIHFLSPFWAIIGLAVALAYSLFSSRAVTGSKWLVTLLKLGFGTSMIASAILAYFVTSYGYLIVSFGSPFLWLLVAEANRDENEHRFERYALAAAGVLMMLQVFPIAGTQMAYASLLPVVAGIVVLSDGVSMLAELAQGDGRIVNRAAGASAALVVLVTFLAAVTAYDRYSARSPLHLPGSERIRLADSDSRLFTAISNRAREGCSVLYSMPGLFSFNFWSGVDTPTPANATAWMTLLNNERQLAIRDALERSDRPCVIYHEQLTKNGLRSTELSSIPLASYILSNFAERARFGEYIFLEKTSTTKK